MRLAACLTLAALTSSAAWPAEEDPHWYLEGQFGTAALDTRLGVSRFKFFDDDSSVAGIEVGYSFGEHFALQGGYHDLGSYLGDGALCPDRSEVCIEPLVRAFGGIFIDLDDAALQRCADVGCDFVAVALTAESTAWSLAAMPRLPLSERLAVRGRVGVMVWETEISAGFGLGRFDSFSGEDLVAGVGLEIGLVDRLEAIVEYRTTDFDLDLVTGGVVWRLPR